MTNRLYIGITANSTRVRFRSVFEPTEASHGADFIYVIGPFRTVAGAEFMRRYGQGNPHCQHVRDAERLAKVRS